MADAMHALRVTALPTAAKQPVLNQRKRGPYATHGNVVKPYVLISLRTKREREKPWDGNEGSLQDYVLKQHLKGLHDMAASGPEAVLGLIGAIRFLTAWSLQHPTHSEAAAEIVARAMRVPDSLIGHNTAIDGLARMNRT